MKRHLLPCSLLCMLLAATTALGGPGDTFYEANLSLTRAARLEKEGDYKAALESGKKAAELLQSLKSSTPEWNPEWVAGKLDAAAQLQQRVEPLAQKAGESKKADYSLKPGERRDFTLQRAYKAHEQQKLIVGAVPAPAPVHGAEPGKSAAPAASGRTEIRVVTPAVARPTVVSRRSAPSRGLPPRTGADMNKSGSFRNSSGFAFRLFLSTIKKSRFPIHRESGSVNFNSVLRRSAWRLLQQPRPPLRKRRPSGCCPCR